MARKLASQRGIAGLQELLVAVPIVLFALSGITSLSTNVFREERRVSARAQATTNAQQALERMTRDIRQGTKFIAGGTSQTALYLHFNALLTPAGGGTAVERQLLWICWPASPASAGNSCFRSESGVGEPFGPLVKQVDHVASLNVFSISPETLPDNSYNSWPDEVDVRLSVNVRYARSGAATPAFGENPASPTVLTDGVQPRNADAPVPDELRDQCDFVPEPPECQDPA